MSEQTAVKSASPAKVTLSQEEYDALIRKSNASASTSIKKEDLIKALEGKSLYAASKALGKSYMAVKNAIQRYGIEYTPVPRVASNVNRKSKTYTLSDEELKIVNTIVFALKNRPNKVDAIKALAADCAKM